MAEYIEREALLAEMRVSGKAAYLVVMDAPAADVSPVVHGRWIAVDDEEQPRDEWDCSACGQRRTFMCEMDADDMKEYYPYCPNCGAKMDGE